MDRILLLSVLALFVAGCATPAPSVPATSSAFSIMGADATMQFDFTKHPAGSYPQLQDGDDLCYVFAGDALIVCTTNGSYLLFGPEDGITLVKDNPTSSLHPADADIKQDGGVQVLGTLFLIAGSVDRLTEGLLDYLDNPGPHRRAAMTLVRELLANDRGELAATGHGGTFTISVHLTDSGREKLGEAVQNDTNNAGIYLVGNKLPTRGDQPFIKRRLGR